MTGVFYLGPCPAEEEAAQSTAPDFNERNKAECLAYIAAIKKVCGEPPEGARLRVKTESHDYRAYREVCIEFDPSKPEAVAYAVKCDESAPTTWEEAGVTPPSFVNGRSR